MNFFITTFTGNKFHYDPELIKKNDIKIEDIAHSLSLLCRFNGHCSYFYSVALHSYLCSLLVPTKYQLHALLHDAAEAYISDIPTPLKNYYFKAHSMEKQIQKIIFQKFNIHENPESNKWISLADKQMLKLEANILYKDEPDWCNDLPDILDKYLKEKIKDMIANPVGIKQMERLFLIYFHDNSF